jgi:hypothetical protein
MAEGTPFNIVLHIIRLQNRYTRPRYIRSFTYRSLRRSIDQQIYHQLNGPDTFIERNNYPYLGEDIDAQHTYLGRFGNIQPLVASVVTGEAMRYSCNNEVTI